MLNISLQLYQVAVCLANVIKVVFDLILLSVRQNVCSNVNVSRGYRFLPRDALLSAVYAVVVCLSVCLCVCACYTPVLYQNG